MGNVRAALFNALLARQTDGRFLLRIEDTDAARSKAEFTQALQEDLAWLGLHWDGEALLQSERGAIHETYLHALAQRGLVYPCFCKPRELELARAAQRSAGQPPRYSGRCRRMPQSEAHARVAAGEPATLRFAVPEGPGEVAFDDLVHGPRVFAHREIGDFVVRRADGSAAFFFSNAIDDSLSGVTHLLRGDDHLSNTPRQLMILQGLDLRAPRYGHLAMVTGADGAPLSKRNGSIPVRALREQGFLPVAVLNYLFRLGHSTPGNELLGARDMAAAFDLGRLQRAPAHFDPAQLRSWQKEAVHRLDADAAAAWLGDRLPAQLDGARRRAFVTAVLPNLLHPDDVLRWVDVVVGDAPQPDADAAAILARTDRSLFRAAAGAAAGNDFAAITAAANAATGLKGAGLFQPLRAALTGSLAGPELAPLLRCMPPGAAQARLARYA